MLRYLAHVVRDTGLEKIVITGKVIEQVRGRPQTSWLKGLTDGTGLSLASAEQKVQDRQGCHNINNLFSQRIS